MMSLEVGMEGWDGVLYTCSRACVEILLLMWDSQMLKM
jgi:hypothetical protein